MANEGASPIAQQLCAMFFGTAISFILHGVTSCQMIWFFRTQSSRSGKGMIALVIFVWLAEVVNCAFMFAATLVVFFLPAISHTSPSSCTEITTTSSTTDWLVVLSLWVARAQTIPSTICTCTVEGFFIMRVWRLSEHKKLTMLLFIPYLACYGFSVAQIVRSFQQQCNPNVSDVDEIIAYSADGSRIFGDGIVVATMCYMLYKRSSGFTSHNNTIKIVRELILWSISTGVLTWMTSVLFLLSVAGVVPLGFTIFFVRAGLYVNAMLAQLNARTRFRAMAEASIPLSTFSLAETPTSSSQASQSVDRELQPARI